MWMAHCRLNFPPLQPRFAQLLHALLVGSAKCHQVILMQEIQERWVVYPYIYIYTSVYHSLSPLLAEYLYISRGQGFLNHQTYFSSKQADVCNNTETLLLGPGKEPLP